MIYNKHYNELAHRAHTARAGFSLIEILIALAIIAIVAGVAVPNYFAYVNRAKLRSAEGMVRAIHQAIITYDSDVHQLPATLKDLVKKPANVEGWRSEGYLGNKKDMPNDPWGNKYQYKLTSGAERPYELYSYGPKGKGAPKQEWIDVWKL